MPCRVGITTDPNTRKTYWESHVIGFKNWRIVTKFKSKEKAQAYEKWYASRYNCRAHAGGPDTPGTWHVYRFDYIRERG
jgi:hypothetical protein